MPSIDDYVAGQEDVARQITAIFEKFKKDGTEHKTEKYVTTRTTSLETFWADFKERHKEMDVIPEHPYFKNNYFGQVEVLYGKIKNLLEARRLALLEVIPGGSGNEHLQLDQSKNSCTQIPIDEQQRRFNLQKSTQTSIMRFISKLEEEPDLSTFRRNSILNKIRTYWSKYEAMHDDIMATITEKDLSNPYFTEEIYDDLEDICTDILDKYSAVPDVSTPTLQSRTNPERNVDFKLPRVEIPKFSGSYTSWRTFHDIFCTIVHNNNELSDVQKMQHLRSSISEEPRSIINHLPLTNSSYPVAWELLNRRYNNKKLLVNAQLNCLMNITRASSETSQEIKRLVDSTTECLLALGNLNIDTTNWDSIIVYMTVQKLPSKTHQKWEEISSNSELATWDELQQFLERRFQTLEAIGSQKGVQLQTSMELHNKLRHPKTQSKEKVSFVSSVISSCSICQKDHQSSVCNILKNLTPSDRYQKIRDLKLCINCLQKGHNYIHCNSKFKCRQCKKKHHTLLHFNKQPTTDQLTAKPDNIQPPKLSAVSQSNTVSNIDHVFLATAVIHILNNAGQPVKCRAMLDSGSQLNFVTEATARRLGLKQQSTNTKIAGIGGQINLQTQKRTNLSLRSVHTNYCTTLEAFVIKSIATNQPNHNVQIKDWPIPNNITLADSTFNQPSQIDVLIGAELFCNLLMVGQIEMSNSLPLLQNTVFGWVVLGKFKGKNPDSLFCGISTDMSLDNQLLKFWQIEERYQDNKAMSLSEQNCEDFFKKTTRRNKHGRYIIRLPFINERSTLGNSQISATRRFFSLEKRLSKNLSLKHDYKQFMDEYLQLGHMELIDKKDIGSSHYIIPHHCVIRPDSISTKLRVVFDASAKTTTNLSLNDITATGPTIQDDLFSILTRFRMHNYVLTCDIAKMYRQILVDKEDRKYQIILWRNDIKDQINFYQLKTVTYGTTSAPYLAVRCLQQLAEDEASTHPIASSIAKRDFYVDDLMTGCNDLSHLLHLQSEMIQLLKAGGFTLHKWFSNKVEVIKAVNSDPHDEHKEYDISAKQSEEVKTLGLRWIPHADQFAIKVTLPEVTQVTKRTILADTARIFDPLGLVNPVIVVAKIFMQELWALKLDWDSSIPMALHSKWLTYRDSLISLNQAKFPRQVTVLSPTNIQLHAFSDASEKAYGTAIYLRSTNEDGNIAVRLLCSKSRVAPTKVVTVPRLELCAAHLMVDLVKKLKISLKTSIHSTTYWTDSEIVLCWLQRSSSSLKTFVANRISDIQMTTRIEDWRHINTKLNPADLISRGVSVKTLLESSLWYNGPEFLMQDSKKWPTQAIHQQNLPAEEKIVKTVLSCSNDSQNIIGSIDHRNSFEHLLRIVAIMIRFIGKCTRKRYSVHESRNKALACIIKYVQEATMHDELQNIRKKGYVNTSSSIKSLAPFIDKDGILRVGGRLQASNLSDESKHQILLPSNHNITMLIITSLHLQHMHAGPQALLSIVRQQYWPIHGKRLAQKIVHNCVLCTRYKPQLMTQIMGNLPTDRVQPTRPFSHIGVDYAGPIQIHYKLRGKRPTKAYICVFVCFATKAIHIETASDLTTSAFIGCLKRMIARRGCPAKIYSDNATNFVGANNALKELADLMKDSSHQQSVINFCSQKSIEWIFIPPRSPHFGGLWEAAVKSAKHHLTKILHHAHLTYEDLNTVVTEIEAILNSRPLTAMSNDPNDLQPLTAGHFLIGEPLTAINNTVLNHETIQNTWSNIKTLKYEFWKRWTRDYLHELQGRNKWTKTNLNLAIGSMVLLKDDNAPPLKWHMARVTDVHLGTDGKVRVVDVKTPTGTSKRAIHNVCPLPIQQVEENLEPVGQTVPSNATITIPSSSIKSKLRNKAHPISNMLLLTCLVIGLAHSGSSINAPTLYNVSHFKNNVGLYHEHIGQVSLTKDNWKIITYFELEQLWHEEKRINELIYTLKNVCTNKATSSFRYYCDIHMQQIYHQRDLIGHKSKLIQQSHTHRFKRGLINAIGVISKELFGILNEQDGQKFYDEISKSRKNEQYLLSLLKNQTSILESTKNILKKNDELMHSQFDLLHKQIIILQAKSGKTNQYFLSILLHLTLIMNGYQETQNSFLNMLMQLHDGKIPLSMLTPEQLTKQRLLIKKKLPHNLIIPGDTEGQSLLTTYSLMQAKGTIKEHRLIVVISIPLINVEKMELYRLIPVPILREKQPIYIQPVSNYIAINFKEEKYHFLHDPEMQRCRFLSTHHILCNQIGPIYNSQGSTLHCEMSLIIQNKRKPSTCNIKKADRIQLWYPLAQESTYIFALEQDHELTCMHQETIIKTTLSGSGIIHLKPFVTVKLDNLEVTASSTFSTQFASTIRTTLSINKLLNSDSSPLEANQFATDNTRTDLSNLEDQINLIKVNEILPFDDISHHDIHQYTIMYITLVCLAAWFIYYMSIKIKQRRRSNSAPATRTLYPIPNEEAQDIELEEFNAGEC